MDSKITFSLILLVVQLGACLAGFINDLIDSGYLYTLDKAKCLQADASVTDDLDSCQLLHVETGEGQVDKFDIYKKGGDDSLLLSAEPIAFSGYDNWIQFTIGGSAIAYDSGTIHEDIIDEDTGFFVKQSGDVSEATKCFTSSGDYTAADCNANNDKFVFVLDCSSISSCLTCKLSSTLPNILCSSCSDNKVVAQPNQDMCQDCSEGTTAKDGVCEDCSTLMPGCTKCTAEDVCTECDNGKTPESKCEECEDGKVDKDGSCTSCNTLMPGCTTCTAEDVCTECDNDKTAESKCTEDEPEETSTAENESDAASFATQAKAVVFIATGLLLLL